MKTWFTADTHFGHDAIRALADRPFGSLAAMDDALIARWNSVVGPDDVVWHLGDFAHHSAISVAAYRARLHGVIHLVAGNHDDKTVREHAGLFASIQQMAMVKLDGRPVILCHYPMREWDKAWAGAYHLHGHVHGRLDDQPHGLSLDVGVDSHDYTPIDGARIAALLAGRTNPFSGGDRAEQSRAQSARKQSTTAGGAP